MVERFWRRLNYVNAFAFNVIGGILFMYAVGIPWVGVVAEIGFGKAFAGSLGFIPGDLVKAGIAAFVAVTLKRAYPIINANPKSAS